MSDLEPITPRDARQRFLERRVTDSTEETLRSYHYRLKHFVEWCEKTGLDNMNDLTGRRVQEFSEHRKKSLNRNSLKNELGTLKKFVEFCVAIEAVEPVMPDKVQLLKPSLTKEEEANDLKISPERAEAILEYLEKYQYASREHALWALLWHTGARISGIRSLDVDDFRPDDLALDFRHRPEEDTPLKNKKNSNRSIALSPEVVEVLEDFIRENRIPATDEFGREPLFTTAYGRCTKNTMRRTCYGLTHACLTGGCPHDRDPQTCDYKEHGHQSKCPSALSPHRIRTGAISHMREKGWPVDDVSERVDATPETVRLYYDKSDEEKRREQRRKHLELL